MADNTVDSWKITATYEDDSQIDIYVADEIPFDEWSDTPDKVAQRYATEFGKLPPGIRDTIMSSVTEHHLGLAHTSAQAMMKGFDDPAVKRTLATT